MENQPVDSLAQFKNSFSYGDRHSGVYKFLKGLSPEDAAAFLEAFLKTAGRALDDGDQERVARLIEEWQVRNYSPKAGAKPQWFYSEGPFAKPAKPLAASKIGLLSAGGHFVEGQDPRPLGVDGMTQEEAERRVNEFLRSEPTLTEIPVDTPPDRLRVRHPGYDTYAAQLDRNVVCPLDRLQELQSAGAVREIASKAWTFVGATSQLALRDKFAPQWAETFKQERLDGLLLVGA
ncbi:MAG: hypothetical protein HY682_10430 [Chloroflexi bacterium]|nr:hypothetical protein [Chloroflexota bacterium]